MPPLRNYGQLKSPCLMSVFVAADIIATITGYRNYWNSTWFVIWIKFYSPQFLFTTFVSAIRIIELFGANGVEITTLIISNYFTGEYWNTVWQLKYDNWCFTSGSRQSGVTDTTIVHYYVVGICCVAFTHVTLNPFQQVFYTFNAATTADIETQLATSTAVELVVELDSLYRWYVRWKQQCCSLHMDHYHGEASDDLPCSPISSGEGVCTQTGRIHICDLY